MADLMGFNAADVEPASAPETMPAGKYVAVIVESEQERNKTGTGSFLKLVHEVYEGKFKGRKLTARLNLDKPQPDRGPHRPRATLGDLPRGRRPCSRRTASSCTICD
jgi:hypothetical protein